MERRFYKELWSIRFDKMLKLEKQSVAAYQALLDESRKRHKGHSIEPNLDKLIADEKKHTLLVQELIEILDRQSDQIPS